MTTLLLSSTVFSSFVNRFKIYFIVSGQGWKRNKWVNFFSYCTMSNFLQGPSVFLKRVFLEQSAVQENNSSRKDFTLVCWHTHTPCVKTGSALFSSTGTLGMDMEHTWWVRAPRLKMDLVWEKCPWWVSAELSPTSRFSLFCQPSVWKAFR